MEPQLQIRREKCLAYHFTEQPLVAFVGNSLSEISASFVIINNLKYSLETPIKAVDTCFKVFHALNAEYPQEVEAVWTFIQQYIFDIKTPHDKKYISVSTLISDLGRL